MPLVTCPKCRERVDIEDAEAGQRAECPACGRTFLVQMTRDGKSKSHGELQAIHRAAHWLHVAASFFFVFGFLTVAGCIVVNLAYWDRVPDRVKEGGRTTLIIIYTSLALALLKYALIERGSRKMSEQRSYGFALLAAFLAILDVVLFPLGIWALLVLLRSDTRKAFRKVAESGDGS